MAKLPEIPKGKELEDYVAAFFHCGRYFANGGVIMCHKGGRAAAVAAV